MGGASSYYSILSLTGFYIAIWLASKLSKQAGISSIVLEIGTGLVLGPQVGHLVPEEYAVCEWEKRISCTTGSADLDRIATDTEHDWCNEAEYADPANHDLLYDSYAECLRQSCIIDLANRCQETPNILTMIGHTGVAMMIFESGMHFDFNQVGKVGPKACVVAFVGTALPLITGALLVSYGFNFDLFPDGAAAGVALAPTSVGIALRLLHEAQALEQPFGQAIITAAFVDDVLSLVLFNILFSSGGGSFTFVGTILPALLGCLFMILAAIMAVKFWPRVISWLLAKLDEPPVEKEDPVRLPSVSSLPGPASGCTKQDAALFLLMVTVLLAHAEITQLCGTHLWGCFTAGMSFALVPEAHHIWVRQTKRIVVWMMRTFFAATVAFAIPVSQLLSVDAFWKGAVLGVGPCILTKVLCAIFMGKPRWVIGWAMVGRAEFAYLIAQMAVASNMMAPECFSIVIWSLLWATIVAPFVFRIVLRRYVKGLKLSTSKNSQKGFKTSATSYLGEILRPSVATSEAQATSGAGLEPVAEGAEAKGEPETAPADQDESARNNPDEVIV